MKKQVGIVAYCLLLSLYSMAMELNTLSCSKQGESTYTFDIITDEVILRALRSEYSPGFAQVITECKKTFGGSFNTHNVKYYVKTITKHFNKYGCGLWIIEDTKTGQAIGYNGVMKASALKKCNISDEKNEKEFIWTFYISPTPTNRQYLLNTTKRIFKQVFTTQNTIKQIDTYINGLYENAISLAKQVGMHQKVTKDRVSVCYAISKAEWEEQKSNNKENPELP